jgi:hypothetical protein
MPTKPGAGIERDATAAIRQPTTARRPRPSLAAAALLLGFEGDPVERVQFANKQVTAIVQVDEAELARRVQVGLGPVLDYRLVEALASLPLGWPVPWEEIDPIVRAVLDCAPPGVLRATPAQAERLLRPVLRVTGILTSTRDWRTGVNTVGILAGHGRPGLVLPYRPRNAEPILARAGRFGIGVVGRDGQGGWQLLLAARRAQQTDLGPRHWRFLETVYDTWCRAHAQPNPGKRTQAADEPVALTLCSPGT